MATDYNRLMKYKELNRQSFPRVLQSSKGGLISRPDITLRSMKNPSRSGDYVTIQEIDRFVKPKAVDNNLMITICDKGYLDVFRLFYRINKMEQYTNLIIFVLDESGYNVRVVILY